MKDAKKYNSVKTYRQSRIEQGLYTFTLDELRQNIAKEPAALRRELDRAIARGEIVSLRRGFFLLIPEERRSSGTLSVYDFIDDLMRFTGHSYYLSLLTAAMLHGSAHQVPMSNFIMTSLPPLRDIRNRWLHLTFPTKSVWPEFGIKQVKGNAGYIPVSSPMLTAIDLFQYQNLSGGFDRCVLILKDLLEAITSEDIENVLQNRPADAIIQRLGFLLETVFEQEILSIPLRKYVANKALHYVPLDKFSPTIRKERDNGWRIDINVSVDLEE
jgi:predicted transcriptional regulator of viral defense system